MDRWMLLALLALLPVPAAALDFAPCSDPSTRYWPGAECARLVVPLHHADRAGEGAELFVRRVPADGPVAGRVWLVAGGPSESGAAFRDHVDAVRRAFPGHDVLVPDHRGTGYSTRLCPREEAVGSPGGTALEGEEWGGCYGALIAEPARVAAFDIDSATQDLVALLRATAGARPSYVYGVSYGTQLILRSLHFDPPPLAGLVLDSLVPPETAPAWDLSMRSHVVDDVGRRVLAACADADACRARFDDDPDVVLRRVLGRMAADPEAAARVPGGDLRRLLGGMLDLPALRVRIPALVAELDADPRATTGLLAVEEAFAAFAAQGADDPQAPISIPLVSVISVSENTLRPDITAAALAEEEATLLFASPLPHLLVGSPLPVYARSPRFGALPPVLPPTLVLAGTLDPKTHHDGMVAHAGLLAARGEVRRIDVVDAPHFVLMAAPDCFVAEVARFLRDPAAGVERCVADAAALGF